jgi:hypothetical protein
LEPQGATVPARLFLHRSLPARFCSRLLTVDLVASGKLDTDFIEYRFGSVTGFEVYRPDQDRDVFETRKTYGVGVYIWHDANSPRGFRIRTAYPMNFD